MLTVELEPETERRLSDRARQRGVSEADLLRAIIEDSLDDLDDIQMAADRLNNRMPPLSGATARKALGLED